MDLACYILEFECPSFLYLLSGPFEKSVWRIKVELLDAYPYKSPSIGFVNKICHPHVDEM